LEQRICSLAARSAETDRAFRRIGNDGISYAGLHSGSRAIAGTTTKTPNGAIDRP
jgi:hypothetical protein